MSAQRLRPGTLDTCVHVATVRMYCDGMSTLTLVPTRLVGRAELALLLGVGRSRAVALSETDDFPPARERLIMGYIWELDDVIAWADRKGRTLHLDALTTNIEAGENPTP